VRILYFTRGYTAHDYRFLSALAGTEHEICYLRLELENVQREERELPGGIQEIEWWGGKELFSYRNSIRLMKDLERVISQFQPQVIHAGPIQTCAFLTAQSGYTPLVSMSWGSDLLVDAERDEQMTWITQYTLDHTQVLVGDCQAVAEKAHMFGFPNEHICLFPWGVDLQHFQPGRNFHLRKYLGWEENPVLLSLRSWELIYGVDVLIKGFAQAVQQEPSLRLLLLGDGSLREHIYALINEYNLEDKIHIAGQIPNQDLVHYYQAADLYLSCSFSDGSSVSLIEALACGLPGLVSDIPGNQEWITPGEQGWLFSTGMPESLSATILSAIIQRSHWQEMGRNARKTTERRADWQKNFKILLGAYDQAVQIKNASRNRL
jgi:L-malate glycosyltransferase